MLIKNFPSDETINAIYDQIPEDSLEHMVLSGMFRQDMGAAINPVETIASSDVCTEFADTYMYVYMPSRLPHGCPAVLVLSPQEDAAEYLESTGWTDLADREKIAVIGLYSKTGWTDPAYDLSLAKRAQKLVLDRKYYNIGKTFLYLAAYGKSVCTAEKRILSNPDSFSGLALVGQDGCGKDELDTLGKNASKVFWIPMESVACPLHIFTDKVSEANKAVRDLFIKCNHSDPEPYTRKGASYYMPDRDHDDNWVQSENVAVVSVYEDPALDPFSHALTDRIWSELKKSFRSLDIINSNTHSFRTMEGWGFEPRSIQLGKWVRTWQEYVPEEARRGHKCPLVIDLHGGSSTPQHAVLQNGWAQVAKVRGLFLAVPFGSLRRINNGMMPHPAWNANGKSAAQDDFEFFDAMINDMLDRYPKIDRERVYLMGHSMGAAMVYQVALKMPDRFAAFAANSGVIRGGFYGSMQAPEGKGDYRVPIIVQMGELDRGGGTFKLNNDAKNTITYWISRNNAGDIDDPAVYRNGPYYHKVYCDPDGIPAVQYITTDNKPHCCTYQDCLMYYDEFFSKFRRSADGTIFYMGRQMR